MCVASNVMRELVNGCPPVSSQLTALNETLVKAGMLPVPGLAMTRPLNVTLPELSKLLPE